VGLVKGKANPPLEDPDFLRAMVRQVRKEIREGYYDLRPEHPIRHRPRKAGHTSLSEALGKHRGLRTALMVELKHASPGHGAASLPALAPAEFVAVAESAGVDALSVIPQAYAFNGRLPEVGEVARASQLPVLFKDFVIDPVQLEAARAWGARGVLLLARLELDGQLNAPIEDLVESAHAHGLQVLLEVHDPSEVPLAQRSRADVLGVNARDLATMQLDAQQALSVLRALRDDHRPLVGMSGIRDAKGVRAYSDAGASAVLVGTSFSRAKDPRAFLHALRGGGSGRP
jgi:indole-3-glycerol phosphate synthase